MANGPLRINAVEEVATGYDEVVAAVLSEARGRSGLALADIAAATGLRRGELAALERGHLAAFASPERLRLAILAYGDCLGLDPSPLLARLEPYARRQLLLPPQGKPPGPRRALGRRRWSRLALAAIVAGVVFAL